MQKQNKSKKTWADCRIIVGIATVLHQPKDFPSQCFISALICFDSFFFFNFLPLFLQNMHPILIKQTKKSKCIQTSSFSARETRSRFLQRYTNITPSSSNVRTSLAFSFANWFGKSRNRRTLLGTARSAYAATCTKRTRQPRGIAKHLNAKHRGLIYPVVKFLKWKKSVNEIIYICIILF